MNVLRCCDRLMSMIVLAIRMMIVSTALSMFMMMIMRMRMIMLVVLAGIAMHVLMGADACGFAAIEEIEGRQNKQPDPCNQGIEAEGRT